MLNFPVRAKLTSILIAVLLIFQLAGCSTEENINSAGVGVGVGTGVGTTSTSPSLLPVLLSWVAPTSREDNTPISLAEISGYRVYYGETQGDYQHQIDINDAYDTDVTSGDLNLTAGTYYAVITTVDIAGRESAYSEEIILTI